jgi:hypothetical protein
VFGLTANQQTGVIAVSGGAAVTFYDAVQNSGLISASAGSEVTILGQFSGNGVAGDGTVHLEGLVQPGPTGAMAFGGDVHLGGASRLEIDVAGSQVGSQQFDRLIVDGTAVLDGALHLSLLGDISGDVELPIVQASELEGAFRSVPPVGANLGFGVRFGGITYDYARDEAVVSLVPGQAGDFNFDGEVNGADLLTWQRELGSTAAYPGMGADANCDGLVDDADLSMWSADIAAALAAASGQIAVQAAVPEPAALGLAVIGGLACCRLAPRRGRRRAS